MTTARPYESEAVRAATGPTIRPGGLALTRRAGDYCRLGPHDRILDVGCGTGATAKFLKARYGATVIGMDLSRILLAEACRQQPDLNAIRADAMALPLNPGCLTTIYAECVCSLLPDVASALNGFYRVLRPGGHLVVADLYWRTPDGTVTIQPPAASGGCLAGAVDRQAMIGRIEAAGFEIELWEDHSDALKQLAVQLVWSGVSLAEWWGVDGVSGNCRGHRRPGYCLIIGRKK